MRRFSFLLKKVPPTHTDANHESTHRTNQPLGTLRSFDTNHRRACVLFIGLLACRARFLRTGKKRVADDESILAGNAKRWNESRLLVLCFSVQGPRHTFACRLERIRDASTANLRQAQETRSVVRRLWRRQTAVRE